MEIIQDFDQVETQEREKKKIRELKLKFYVVCDLVDKIRLIFAFWLCIDWIRGVKCKNRCEVFRKVSRPSADIFPWNTKMKIRIGCRVSVLQKCSTVSSNMHRTNEQWMMIKLWGPLKKCAGSAFVCNCRQLQVECYFKKMFELTFWFVLLLIGMYVCRLQHTIAELFALFPVIPGYPSIGQCEWANLWIRRLDCWFQQWAETRTKYKLLCDI